MVTEPHELDEAIAELAWIEKHEAEAGPFRDSCSAALRILRAVRDGAVVMPRDTLERLRALAKGGGRG